jgi:hypothetical protein
MLPKPVPKNIEIVVSSYGGSGSSLLLNFLKKYKTTNQRSDADMLKHHTEPPLSVNPDQKFIYIFGNPVYATISLFRRNFQFLQSSKVQKRIPEKKPPIPEEMTLEKYAELGIDRFAMREQFHNWYHSTLQNPIMFLKYERLFDNLEAVIEFCDLPMDVLNDFPEKKMRSSVDHLDSSRTLLLLQNMHHELLNELEELPDFEIREPKKLGAIHKTTNQVMYARSWVRYKAAELVNRANKKIAKMNSN